MIDKTKAKIVELVPEIMNLPEYPYNPDAAKAVKELNRVLQDINLLTSDSKKREEIQSIATLHLQHYEDQRRSDYIAMLKNEYPGRPIRLADVLLALVKGKGIAPSNFFLMVNNETSWNLSHDSYDEQSQETKDFLSSLLTQ